MDIKTAIENKTKAKLFVSLSKYPGTTGKKFYTQLFSYYNIDAEYVPCESANLEKDIKLVRTHCAGASISMPYKTMVWDFLNSVPTPITPVNTILNNPPGYLTGFNCDLMGMEGLLLERLRNKQVIILGDGAMAWNFKLLCSKNNARVHQFSRKQSNWHLKNMQADVIINCTSIGMHKEESVVEKINADLVIDCVIGNTELIKQARLQNKETVTGSDLYVAQLEHQFAIYTNIYPERSVIQNLAKEIFTHD